MKKLLIIPLLFACFFAFSQAEKSIYSPSKIKNLRILDSLKINGKVVFISLPGQGGTDTLKYKTLLVDTAGNLYMIGSSGGGGITEDSLDFDSILGVHNLNVTGLLTADRAKISTNLQLVGAFQESIKYIDSITYYNKMELIPANHIVLFRTTSVNDTLSLETTPIDSLVHEITKTGNSTSASLTLDAGATYTIDGSRYYTITTARKNYKIYFLKSKSMWFLTE